MITFKDSLAKATQRLEPQSTNSNIAIIAAGVATVAAVALPLILSGTSTYTTTTDKTNSTNSNKNSNNTSSPAETKNNRDVNNESPVNPETLPAKEKKDKVVKIIQQNRPDFNIQNKFVDELVAKYELYTSCHPEWDDSYVAKRLNLYLNALESNATMVKYGEISSQGAEAIEGMKNNTVVDESITTGIAANKDGKISEEYLNSIENRGVGYLDLYDENSDGVVSFEEFVKREEKDSGKTLTDEEKLATKKYFDFIDKDNSNNITAKEMASHLYAMSRLYDFDSEGHTKSNTADDISFMEWYGAQSDNTNIRQRLNGISESLFNAIKNR